MWTIGPGSGGASDRDSVVFCGIPQLLAVGDEVVTNGGLLGRITKLGESFLTVELADNVQIKIQRHAVSSIMPKGTIKSA